MIAVLYGSLGLLAATFVLVLVANFVNVFEYGYGTSSFEIGIWQSCSSTGCYHVTSNSQCSELSSRMKATGAFDIIALVSIIAVGAAFFAEGKRRHSFPVNHLTKILVGWLIVSIVIDVSVVIGTYVAKLCSNPLSIKDQSGNFGPAFFLFFAAFITSCASAGLYGFFMSKRSDDDDDPAQQQLRPSSTTKRDDTDDL